MNSKDRQDRGHRLARRKDPETVSLRQAVHWISTGEQPVRPEDEHALGRKVDSSTPEFQEAMLELMLALRHGNLQAGGLGDLGPGEVSRDNAVRLPNTRPWLELLEPYVEELKCDPPRLPVIPIPRIPEDLWDTQFLDWKLMFLSFRNGPITCDIFEIALPFADLKQAFATSSRARASRASEDDDRLHVRVQQSLLKLVAGISVAKYRYNPDDERTKSTGWIVDDLERVGTPLSKDTVRNLLDIASKYIPKDGIDEG